MDPDSEPRLRSLVSQLMSGHNSAPETLKLILQIISLTSSMDFESQPESKFMSLVAQTISVFHSMDLDSQPKPLSELISLITQHINSRDSKYKQDSDFASLLEETLSLEPKPELISLIHQILSLFVPKEPELIFLITVLIYGEDSEGYSDWILAYRFMSLIIRIISLIISLDVVSQPKPESELMSLVTQTITVFNSMVLDSQPKPLSELISRISKNLNSRDMELAEFISVFEETLRLKPESELMSLIYQILSLVHSKNSKLENLITLCPQVQVSFEKGKIHVNEEVSWSSNNKWDCFPVRWEKIMISGEGEDASHFLCRNCNGQNHKEYEKAAVEVKHPLHQKHSLQLVLLRDEDKTRKCYCCDEDLIKIFYCCSACDFAMNIACVEKPPPFLSIHQPNWHEHTLALFPRKTSLTCELCALADSSCPFYICPPCDFVVHQSCLSLPRVIRISRHLHRISFTPYFDKGDWSCGVCRKKIDSDYGGYSCIKNGCSSYVAHSRCATQSNVWDGVDLEGVPEDVEEEEDVEPFVRIGDGIIQHFSHQQHHLRLDVNTDRDYDDNKQCQACITPIYFGNFYSCMTCDFILHDECANFSRKIHNAIHPHLLTLVTDYDGEDKHPISCSACPWLCTSCYFYECGKEGCDFRLHLQCATVSEPLVHTSHTHPLFLTSKPEERRTCYVCQESGHSVTNETFNCIECEFSLCFKCATLPQRVRYKHDRHMLTLSYGKETSTMEYWCEACEGKINPQKRFYKCDEYCCVTLHIKCLLGGDFYLKPDPLTSIGGYKVSVELNDHHMSRPICFTCKKRCPHKVVFHMDRLIFCSTQCVYSAKRYG